MDYYEEVLASYHEASHAVATVALGGRLESVTLNQSTRARDCPLVGRDLAVMSIAGAVGARALGPRRHSYQLCRDHSDADLALAEVALGLGAGQLRPYQLANLETAARAVLLDNDRYVRRVAGAIRQAGKLSGADVARICNDEPVEAVLAPAATARTGATPAGAAPRTKAEALAVGRANRIAAAGKAVVRFTLEPVADGFNAVLDLEENPLLGQLEAFGATEDAAADRFGEMAAEKLGCPVELAEVKE